MYQGLHYDPDNIIEEDGGDISQEDCWAVIQTFFNDKGLVRQQLDSFDEFVQNTMQEIVDENRNLVLQTIQGSGNEGDQAVRNTDCFPGIELVIDP